MSTPLTSTAVTAATEEEVATMRCTNSKEAIKYEKDLCAAMEAAFKCLQKGSDAAEDVELKDVMPNLIKYFKTKIGSFSNQQKRQTEQQCWNLSVMQKPTAFGTH